MALIDNLEAYYELEESSGSSAADSHSTHTGTYVGNLPTAVTGIINNGQNPDGSGDYIDLVDYAFGTGQFTVNFWFKRSAFGSDEEVFGNYFDDGSGASGIRGFIRNSGAGVGQFQVFLFDDGTSANLNGPGGTGSETPVDDGAWHMITLVRDGTNVKLYLDSVEEDSISDTGLDLDSGAVYKFFIVPGITSQDFSGTGDELGIWKGKGLSQSEINELYNGGAGLAYSAMAKTSASIQKSLQYSVKSTPTAISKSLQYSVQAPVSIQKSLTYKVEVEVSGQVTLGGVGQSGVTVTIIDSTNDTVYGTDTTDGSGNYSFTVPSGNTWHVAVEYDDGGTKYNAPSKPFIST